MELIIGGPVGSDLKILNKMFLGGIFFCFKWPKTWIIHILLKKSSAKTDK